MGMYQNVTAPNIPVPPEEYEPGYFERLHNILNAYFLRSGAVQQLNLSKLNLDTSTLPTEADVATLRVGDVYRDSTASNVLKVKV